MTECVYITTSDAADADYYHSHRCASTSNSDVKEIAGDEASTYGLSECQICQRYAGGVGPHNGLARQLAKMHVDDVLGGDPA